MTYIEWSTSSETVPQPEKKYKREDITRVYNYADLTIMRDIDGNTLGVYLYLKIRQGRKDSAFPSQATIAAELGISKDTVTSCLEQLALNGLIEVKRGAKKNGDIRHVNHYSVKPVPKNRKLTNTKDEIRREKARLAKERKDKKGQARPETQDSTRHESQDYDALKIREEDASEKKHQRSNQASRSDGSRLRAPESICTGDAEGDGFASTVPASTVRQPHVRDGEDADEPEWLRDALDYDDYEF